jgi:hypothetical protein
MDIIHEKRKDILDHNNFANRELENFLAGLNTSITELHITVPLHGSVDLATLDQNGFTQIRSITFSSGDITDVMNIPIRLTHFICPNNILTKLENLPATLIHLEIPYNFLTELQGTLPQLVHLNLSNNVIENLGKLPNSLVELYINNNRLTGLNLRGLDMLKKLYIQDNKITIIENLPNDLQEFNMDNNPPIQFENSVYPGTKIREPTTGRDYLDSLDEYFKLKSQYETKAREMRKRAFDSAPNKKAGRLAAAAVKPLCIQCKRPVGTIFSKKYTNYSASCGSSTDPCNLKIELYSGLYTSSIFSMEDTMEDVEKEKGEIIKHKLDALFNYITEKESLELYKKTLESYNLELDLLKHLKDGYEELFENPIKMDSINKKRKRIFILREQLRNLLKEYATTENQEILKAAVKLQVDQLIPEHKNLMLLENEVMEMEGKMLHKFAILPSRTDTLHSEEPKVVHWTKK